MWKLVLLSSLVVGAPAKPKPLKASAAEKQEMIIPALTRDVLARVGEPVALTKAERKLLALVVAGVKKNPKVAPEHWGALVESWSLRTGSTDIAALIQWVVRESYLETTEDLKHHADKLKFFNEKKKKLRDQIKALNKKLERFKGHAKLSARTLKITPTYELGIEPVEPGEMVIQSADEWEAELKKWDEALQAAGKDAQLANIDLQNALMRKQHQQTLQMLSNLSKSLQKRGVTHFKKIR